jgi:hypothetical protein
VLARRHLRRSDYQLPVRAAGLEPADDTAENWLRQALMRKGVSHGNMQCVDARLLAPFCDLDRISKRVPVPRGKDAKRAVQVVPGEFYDERKLASDRILNGLDYLQQEPCPILQSSSVTIRSVISGGTQELSKQIAVGGMKLDSVHLRGGSAFRGPSEQLNDLVDVRS